MIRRARTADLESLQTVEILAGEAFRALGMDSIADDDPPALDELRRNADAGRAWVAVDAMDNPIAYILLDEMDGAAHIAQVTVHPKHARQGIGKNLIEEAGQWAARHGLSELSLTTFRNVPWNAPYYARLGFIESPESSWSEELRRRVQAEALQGLGAWPRVVMRRNLPAAE